MGCNNWFALLCGAGHPPIDRLPAHKVLVHALPACPPITECRATYEKLVAAGTLVPAADKAVPPIPQDLAAAVAQGKVGRSGRPSWHVTQLAAGALHCLWLMAPLRSHLQMPGPCAHAHREHHLRRPGRGAVVCKCVKGDLRHC